MTDTSKTQSERPSPIRWSVTPKGKNPAHIGASVIHPDGSVGVVVGGQNSVTFGGKPAACIGDKVECPGHTGVIIQGAKSVSIGGKSLAREGDKTSCGGVIMNGFPTITVFDAGKTVHGKSTEENTREIKLSLLQSFFSEDKKYIGMPYKLKIDGVVLDEGISDEKGDFYIEIKQSVKEFELLLENNDSYLISVLSE
ncbi:MAG: PAAR domain-containing protein [Lonepinella koalarum]|nr:PAAR domain-containing protein [Lonepinella koalarum]